MCFGGDKKRETKPTPVAAPIQKVVAPLQMDYKTDNSTNRNRTRSGTLLTSGLGMLEEAQIQKKTLLGQ